MALALRQSHEKLKELAEHDSLTKLVNRYGFELCLNRTLSQVKRHQDMLAVILLDLDDFKGINDTLGHQVGISYWWKWPTVSVRRSGRGSHCPSRRR